MTVAKHIMTVKVSDSRLIFPIITYFPDWSKPTKPDPASTGSPVNVLQEAQVPLVDRKQCQQKLPQYNITSSMLCAGFPEGGVDSCQVTHVPQSKLCWVEIGYARLG